MDITAFQYPQGACSPPKGESLENLRNSGNSNNPRLADLNRSYRYPTLSLEDQQANRALLEEGLHFLETASDGLEDASLLIPAYLWVGTLLLDDRGDPRAAMEYFQKALTLAESVYGEEGPQCVAPLSRIGEALVTTDRPEDALPLLQRALTIETPSTFDRALALNTLGRVYKALEESDQARVYYQKALDLIDQDVGEHPLRMVYLSNLAEGYKADNKLTEALETFKEALASSEKWYRPDHSNLAILCTNIGSLTPVCDEENDFYQRALGIALEAYEEDHPTLAIYYGNLGRLLQRLKEPRAIDHLRRAAEIAQKHDSPQTYLYLYQLGLAYAAFGSSEALVALKDAYASAVKILGKDHPDTKKIGMAFLKARKIRTSKPGHELTQSSDD